MTKKEIKEANLLIALFDGWVSLGLGGNYTHIYKRDNETRHIRNFEYHSDWNEIMAVVDKIEEIGTSMEIRPHHSYMSWFYSPKKTITYSKGAGGGGGWTDPRKPFDSIGGKHY